MAGPSPDARRPPPPLAGEKLTNRPSRAAIGLTILGSFLVSMDVSVVNAIQPAIAHSFGGADTAGISWTITAYAITFAAVLVPAGRVADRAGRRRTFLGGLIIFAFGSLICGLAPDLPVLLGGRVLQGAGATAAQPASLGLLRAVTPPAQRTLHTARWGAGGAVGIALGPVVGGSINSAISWRWAFLINLPLVLLACVLIPRLLPETDRHPGRPCPTLSELWPWPVPPDS